MKTLLAFSAALALPGCTTLQSVGESICEREPETRMALELALTQAYTIADDTARNATLAGIQASLAALDVCEARHGA